MLLAQDPISKANCRDLPNEAQLRQWLIAAKGDDIGGLFKGELMVSVRPTAWLNA
jgi:hypothetical protein